MLTWLMCWALGEVASLAISQLSSASSCGENECQWLVRQGQKAQTLSRITSEGSLWEDAA